MEHMETRDARVMVKLAGPGGAPDEVLFTQAQREAVVEAAVSAGYVHLSTFIRELAVDVAMSTQDRGKRSDRQLLQAAAQACGMRLGRWLWEVTLAGIGHVPEEVESPLPKHRREAARWYRKKVAA